jgi:hypothetical protein
MITTKGRINIQGSMKALVVGEVVVFPRGICRPSSIRNAASIIREDYGKRFNVNVRDDSITVTRIA